MDIMQSDKYKIDGAIHKLKDTLTGKFGAKTDVYLFGSVARGDYDDSSDIDVLVLVPFDLSNDIEERIFDLAYDIELEFGVVFGIVVYSKTFWHSQVSQGIPLFKNIRREGVAV